MLPERKEYSQGKFHCAYYWYTNQDNKHIFPDPDRVNDNNDDILDDVIHRYSDNHIEFEEDFIDDCINSSRSELVKTILQLLEEGNFSQREKLIFKEVVS